MQQIAPRDLIILHQHDLEQDLCVAGIVVLGVVGLEIEHRVE